MPLKLIPPRAGKTPNWTIRGTYLGQYVEKSAGTPNKKIARQALTKIREQIEAGEFAKPGEPTFLSAAVAYIEAGGEVAFSGPMTRHRQVVAGLILHFGETPLRVIGQAEIDAAATELHPNDSPATRNRQVHTPVSAILRHAGVKIELRRPKGAAGRVMLHWLWPEQFEALAASAMTLDPELFVLVMLLVSTGMRIERSARDQVRRSSPEQIVRLCRHDEERRAPPGPSDGRGRRCDRRPSEGD